MVVPLEEVKYGLDAIGQCVMSCDPGNAQAFLAVGEHNYHTMVTRGRECTFKHCHHALALVPGAVLAGGRCVRMQVGVAAPAL